MCVMSITIYFKDFLLQYFSFKHEKECWQNFVVVLLIFSAQRRQKLNAVVN